LDSLAYRAEADGKAGANDRPFATCALATSGAFSGASGFLSAQASETAKAFSGALFQMLLEVATVTPRPARAATSLAKVSLRYRVLARHSLEEHLAAGSFQGAVDGLAGAAAELPIFSRNQCRHRP